MYPLIAPALVLWGIAGLALLVLAATLALTQRAARRAGASVGPALGVAAAWLGAVTGLSLSGVLARFEARPPPLALFMAGLIAGALWLGLSRRTRFVVDHTPLALLVGLQAFRLPLELVMHEAARSGVMPVQLSFSGYNFDILTGSFALVLAPLVALGRAPRWALVAWNALGFACLFAIVVIAVLTAPFIRAFGDGSVNTWVAYVPFVYLPAVMVVVALAGHCWVARWLRAHPAPAPGTHTARDAQAGGRVVSGT